MKLTIVLLTAAFVNVYATGLSQSVTFSGKDVSLEKVLNVVERQTGYVFFYTASILEDAKTISIDAEKLPVEEFLQEIFKNQPLSFSIENKAIVISRKIDKLTSLSRNSTTHPPPVIGYVRGPEGQPLSGVNVVVKGTKKGTVTDKDGKFSIDAEDGFVLQISSIGFGRKEIIVNRAQDLVVTLEIASSVLDEVQYIAYGQTSRRLNTGNIAKVSAAEIEKQPVMNPLQALQGRVPGLIITQTNGYASAPVKVELRGRKNLSNQLISDPLYIVDGVPLTISEVANKSSYHEGASGFLQNNITSPAGGLSPLFSINPADIESIEVLKDADATSIYGSRGANGVILITTKRGKAGRTKMDGSISHGVRKVTRRWEMLNLQQYIEMRNEAFRNDSATMTSSNAYDILDWDTTRFTDWQKYLWENTGRFTDAQIGLSGGDNQTTFRLGSGYTRSTDITTYSGADERACILLSLGYKSLNRRFSLAMSNIFSYAKSDMIPIGGNNLAVLPPTAPPVLDAEGKPNYAGWQPQSYNFENLFQPYTSKTHFLNTNLTLNYEVLTGLKIRSSLGYNSGNVKQTKFVPISSLNPAVSPTGRAYFGANEIRNWIIEPQVEYNRFIGSGRFDLLAGSTFQTNSTSGQSVEGTGYTSDLLLYTISNAPNKNADEFYGEYRYTAFFGRLTYNWQNKYIVNLSARRDGSSRFGLGKSFGNFKSAAIAWIFTEEPFIKRNIRFVSFGKLRGSYGTTGSDGIGDYKYLTRWSSSGYYPYGGISPLVPLQHANDQYQWSTNRKLEAAVDLGFFEDRVFLSVAWYRDRCDDQLIDFPLAAYTGFPSVVANSPANIQNTGWEVSMSGTIIRTKDLQWTLSVNSAVNRNKLLSFPDLENSSFAPVYIIGKPLNFKRLLHYTGVDPQTGQYTFEDKTKDGIISTNLDEADDRNIIEMNPSLTAGLGSNFTYKGLGVSLFFQIVKQKGINALFSAGATPGTPTNTSLYVFNNRWRHPGDERAVARFTTMPSQSYSNFYDSDGVYADASYIRLSNIAVSYSIPAHIANKAGLRGAQLRITAQNLFTITRYKGIDPETQNFGAMPPSKVINGGITFNL